MTDAEKELLDILSCQLDAARRMLDLIYEKYWEDREQPRVVPIEVSSPNRVVMIPEIYGSQWVSMQRLLEIADISLFGQGLQYDIVWNDMHVPSVNMDVFVRSTRTNTLQLRKQIPDGEYETVESWAVRVRAE